MPAASGGAFVVESEHPDVEQEWCKQEWCKQEWCKQERCEQVMKDIAQMGKPSNADLVYEVLRSAERPLTFQEIFDEVNRRQPITTRDPKATIRSALGQGKQLVSLGDGRYGYLPHLVSGSLLRVPLAETEPANNPLLFSDDVRQALWPGYFDTKKHRDTRPIHVRLPGGDEIVLSLNFFGPGIWGSPPIKDLQDYLAQSGAAPGDSLLIRVIAGEEGRAEAWLEPRQQRDEAAVARRNRELADVAQQIMRTNPRRALLIYELIFALLGRGAYRADVAPDSLAMVLKADRRFVDTGLFMWLLAEAVTPGVQALGRQRKQAEKHSVGSQKTTAGAGIRSATEQTLADLEALISQHASNPEELGAILQGSVAKGSLPRRRAATALQQAQDLMYDAWETANSRERVRMAKNALAISADCADAYVLLAEETARNPEEAADLYAKGVAAGERALGKTAFEEDAGHFWGFVETRPYMRARLGLAEACWELGRRREAIGHAWAMLRLNTNDNQGVRYILLGWLLESGDGSQVQKLLDTFPDDGAAAWLYGQALHTFCTRGDSRQSRSLLARAQQANRHVPAYLLGRKRMPKMLPETMIFGDESEAVVCVFEQMLAWHNTPGAVLWLAAHPGPS
jgi:tetratricopeptide (TPR) repeat protein